jgi:hypothetical protein
MKIICEEYIPALKIRILNDRQIFTYLHDNDPFGLKHVAILYKRK